MISEVVSRIVRDQAGLDVTSGRTVVRQTSPDGGSSTIYVVARLVEPEQPDLVGGHGEWAETRWLTLAEAEELLPDMYSPVHAYLSRALRPRYPSA